jgi:hypothetical protein
VWWRAALAASVALIGIGAVCAQPKASGINWSPRGINTDSVFGRADNRIQDRRLLNLLAETEFVLNAGNSIRVGSRHGPFSAALPECADGVDDRFSGKKQTSLAVAHSESQVESLLTSLLLHFQHVISRTVEIVMIWSAEHKCSRRGADCRRVAGIFQRKPNIDSQISRLLSDYRTVKFGDDGNPGALGGSECFLKRVIGFKQNGGAYYGSYEEKRSPKDKPFGEARDWITLPKPPPWLWQFLLCAAGFFSLLGLILSPNAQPAPALRNALSLGLYLLGIALAILAIPAFLR